jgi:hypothetical protein
MSKHVIPQALKAALPDPRPTDTARVRAFQGSKDSRPIRGGTSGRLKKSRGSH